MIVMGIDPGLTVTGYGLVFSDGNRLGLENCGMIRTKPDDSLGNRLRLIREGLSTVIDGSKVTEAACETVFLSKNFRSSMMMSHARGVIFELFAEKKISVFEYSPREIKKSLTGNGNAGKEQVKYMVKSILGEIDEYAFDVFDAIAIALTHINKRSFCSD
ncbi:crossover junction endodeoxyribonuclease RuvC [candidate division WOR-3 bacterium]|nr:crossover junction endodeoxyribonuclease RuvC [candidate division WOR-3 bacterium]